MLSKWNNKIIVINEYLTSKICCNCRNIKNDLGANKVYEFKYNLIIDIDINALINIYK